MSEEVVASEESSIRSPPSGFADLYEANARLNQQVNIMGVVVDYMAPSPTRGSDMQCSFTLQDPISWIDDSNFEHTVGGLKVKFFAPSIKALPRIQTIGDVVLLRSIGMKQWQGNTNALSNRSTQWTVFPGRMIPAMGIKQDSGDRKPLAQWSSNATSQSTEEEAYAIWLRQWSLDNEFFRSSVDKAEAVRLAAEPSSSGAVGLSESATLNNTGVALASGTAPIRNRFMSLCEASGSRFCDVVAEVIKVFPTGMGKEVYITDYTENQRFFNYPLPDSKKQTSGNPEHSNGERYDEYATLVTPTAHRDWPGPWGQHVLCVMLFHPHATAELKEHDFVSIRNLRIVTSKTGDHLEGKLHQDRRRPDQIDITKVKISRTSSGPMDSRLSALRERKDEYWSKYIKPAALDGYITGQNAAMSKADRKRDKKRKREELKRQNQKKAAEVGTLIKPVIKSNQHVRCSYPDKSVASVANILDNDNRLFYASDGTEVVLPFVNMICRANVRIIDFYPPDIKDFSQLAPARQEFESDDDEPSQSQHDRWQWAFCLLVEDASASDCSHSPHQLRLVVAGDAADFLLKLDASNLREDRSTLSRLKLRLSFLWGDLDEIKAKHNGEGSLPRPSNLPFECCIQEYGVPVGPSESSDRGWKAVYRMVQTTVSASFDD